MSTKRRGCTRYRRHSCTRYQERHNQIHKRQAVSRSHGRVLHISQAQILTAMLRTTFFVWTRPMSIRRSTPVMYAVVGRGIVIILNRSVTTHVPTLLGCTAHVSSVRSLVDQATAWHGLVYMSAARSGHISPTSKQIYMVSQTNEPTNHSNAHVFFFIL